MKNEKNQTMRIIDGFITAVVIITSVTLVASGIAISKANTEYLETGVRAPRIVAEKESVQIFVSESESVTLASDKGYSKTAEKVLSFLPPPVNTVFIAFREIRDAADGK